MVLTTLLFLMAQQEILSHLKPSYRLNRSDTRCLSLMGRHRVSFCKAESDMRQGNERMRFG